MPQKVPRRTRIRRRVFRNSHAEQFRRGYAYGDWCFFLRDMNRKYLALIDKFLEVEPLDSRLLERAWKFGLAYLRTEKHVQSKEKEMSQ